MPKPKPSFNPIRLLPLLLATMLPAAPAAAPVPMAVEAVDARISRCFELRRSQPRQAVEVAEALLADSSLGIEPTIKALSCLGVAAAIVGDTPRAASSARLIEQHLERHPALAPEFRLRALSNAGGILHGIGQVYRAEQMYTEAARVGEAIGGQDARMIRISTLNNIGLIHADYLDSPQAADEYYRKALALADTVDHDRSQLLYNFAINLTRLDRREQALHALEQAEANARDKRNVLIGHRIHAARLGLLLQAGNAQASARELLRTATEQRKLADAAGEAATLAWLAQAQRLQGHYPQALESARQAWQVVGKGHYPQEQYQVLRELMDIHAALGQTDELLQRGRQFHTLKMDALKQQRLEMLADLQARTQSADSQRELERMQHESQIQALSSEKNRLMRTTAIVLLSLLVIVVLAFGLMQRRRHRQLRRISEIDALTGLNNRHAATATLNALAAQRGPEGTRHTLFLIDVDHFKHINDTYGHHAGDEVLVEVSARLKAACRPSDLVARWGGEEFLVACPNLTREQAEQIAGRLRRAMAHTLEVGDAARPVTVSLGLAPIPFFDVLPEDHVARRWDYALRMADRALYAAKKTRNAWVGYWGAQLPDDATAEAVLEQPEAAEGIITVMSSVPRAASVSAARAESLREAGAQI